MTDHFLARPWQEAEHLLAGADSSYVLTKTRSPRDFFAVDEASLYVVRVRENDGRYAVTLTPAPARSASVAAYEEKAH